MPGKTQQNPRGNDVVIVNNATPAVLDVQGYLYFCLDPSSCRYGVCRWCQHAGQPQSAGWTRVGLDWVTFPGIGRTKAVLGRLWCQAKEPVQ
eukprot:1150050-Pelagomonas_calceolata.AAC.2